MNILLIENDLEDAQIIRSIINDEMKMLSLGWHHVTLLQDAIERLIENHYDLILLDLILPDNGGLNSFIEIKYISEGTPIIVLCEHDNIQLAIHAVQNGAQEYLIKGDLDRKTISYCIRFAQEKICSEYLIKKHSEHFEELVQKRTKNIIQINNQFIQEVVERKKIEKHLKNSEERYRMLLESITDGVFVLSHDWVFLMVNDGTEHFFSKSKESLINKSIFEVFPNIEQNNVFSAYKQVMAEQKPRAVIDQFTYINGDLGWSENHIYPVTEGILCIITDITQRKLYEETILKISKKLEKSTRQLKKTNRELKKASNARSEFFAKMSHELRTPLNVILANAQMLHQGFFGILNDIQKTKHSEILHHSEELLFIIQNILDYSKLSVNKMKIQKTWINISEIIKDLVQNLSPLLIRKDVDIKQDIDDPVNILADALRIRQAISNILTNAIKNTDNGFIKISIKKLSSQYIQIIIQDTGKGISKQNITHIFEDFYQVPYQNNSGTGLGLSIAKSFIDMHSGKINVESKLNQGTIFSVNLPINNEDNLKSEDNQELSIVY